MTWSRRSVEGRSDTYETSVGRGGAVLVDVVGSCAAGNPVRGQAHAASLSDLLSFAGRSAQWVPAQGSAAALPECVLPRQMGRCVYQASVGCVASFQIAGARASIANGVVEQA